MPSLEKYSGPSDLPARIPVFPLRGAILLPRATLPLNVFEPRFLAMTDDVLAGARLIGILQPDGGDPRSESPAGKSVGLRHVGCAGRLTAFQEIDSGRLAITLTGICRFEVLGEAETATPYRVMSVSYDRFAQDFTAGHGEELVDRAALLAVLSAYLTHNGIEMDWHAIENAATEHLVNTLSIMSPYGSEEKQALLEAQSLKERADVLMTLAQMELAGHGGAGGTMQ